MVHSTHCRWAARGPPHSGVFAETGGGVAEVDLSDGSFTIPAEPPVFRLLESVEPPEGAFPVIRVDVGDPRADPPEPMVSGAAVLEPGFPPNQPPFGSDASAFGGALPMEGSATLGILGTFEDPLALLSIPLGAAGVGTATGGFLDQRDPQTGFRIQVWGNPWTTGEVRTFDTTAGPGTATAGPSFDRDPLPHEILRETGFDRRDPDGLGPIRLVTAVGIWQSATNTTTPTVFAIADLIFVPEPGPARGLVAAGASLAAVAFTRRRRARDAGAPSP